MQNNKQSISFSTTPHSHYRKYFGPGDPVSKFSIKPLPESTMKGKKLQPKSTSDHRQSVNAALLGPYKNQ